MAEAIEWVLTRQHEAAAREMTEEGKRPENRRYQGAVYVDRDQPLQTYVVGCWPDGTDLVEAFAML